MIRSFALTLAATLAAIASAAAPAPTTSTAPAPASAPATTPAPVVSFAGDAPSVTLPIEVANNHVYVQATIDGKPFTLLVDVGGVDLLTPAAAAALGLHATDTSSPVRPQRLELGGFAQSAPEFYVVDLKRLPDAEGVEFAGTIGYDTLQHAVVRIDYSGRQLMLSDPATFRYAGDGARLRFQLDGRVPVVDATVDGIAGRFAIDTGSRASLALAAPFVRQHGLLDRYPHRHPATTGWGMGGPVRAFVSRARELDLGTLKVAGPVVELGDPADRSADQDASSGSIGGGVLRRFAVTLDFARSELILEPGAEFTAPDLFDRSGMWFNLDQGDLIVDDLVPNGPGARAQIQKGDRLVSVDGASASAFTLASLRARLREAPAGARVHMSLRRDGRVIYAVMVLEDQVPAP